MGPVLNLPVIHLDAHYWQPGWQETPADDWQDYVRDAVKQPHWVMDGNYLSTLGARLSRADTVIYLHCPRWRSYLRVFSRWLRYWHRTRPDMGPGCLEKVDWEFIRWIWRFPEDYQPMLMAELEQQDHPVQIIHLYNRQGTDLFLKNISLPPTN